MNESTTETIGIYSVDGDFDVGRLSFSRAVGKFYRKSKIKLSRADVAQT